MTAHHAHVHTAAVATAATMAAGLTLQIPRAPTMADVIVATAIRAPRPLPRVAVTSHRALAERTGGMSGRVEVVMEIVVVVVTRKRKRLQGIH